MQTLQTIDNFGALLNSARRAQLTQMETWHRRGYNEAHISRLENSQRLPDLAVLAALLSPPRLQDEHDLATQLLELARRARGEIFAVQRYYPHDNRNL